MTTDTYRIAGMTCEHCIRAVTDEISALDGVTRVDIDLVVGGTSTATVHHNSTPGLDTALVADAVEEAGYVIVTDLPPA